MASRSPFVPSVVSSGTTKGLPMLKAHPRDLQTTSDNSFIRNVDFLWAKLGHLSLSKTASVLATLKYDDVTNWIFTHVVDVNVSRVLLQIAYDWSHFTNGEYEYAVAQVRFSRAWTLFLMGLLQHDALDRYMAMTALSRILPTIKHTCPDTGIQEMLISTLTTYMVSDCRVENRLKAICLLAQLGMYMSEVAVELLVLAFKKLAKLLLQIQISERSEKGDPNPFRTKPLRILKIHLIHALGKYTKSFHKHTREVEDLLLYMLCTELDSGDTNLKPDKKGKINEGAACVALTILNVLNNDVPENATNHMYVGALVKRYVLPLVRGSHRQLQSSAIQFVSKWLPIKLETAHILGHEALLSGLQKARELGVFDNHLDLFASQKQAIESGQKQAQLRVSVRSKIIRQMLMVPGTFAQLRPASKHAGLFHGTLSGCDLLCSLPINEKSQVLISRPQPALPGVPNSATTIPPVFVDPNVLSNLAQPRSNYEWLERIGQVLGLPSGYTYSPQALVDLDGALKEASPKVIPNSSMRDRNVSIGIGKSRSQPLAKPSRKNDLPPGALRNPPPGTLTAIADPNKAPYGFSTLCPFPGYDPEMSEAAAPNKLVVRTRSGRLEAKTLALAAGAVDGLPPGYTTDKRVLILQSSTSQALKSGGTIVDFPENAPVMFDIIQPGTQKLQRVLTRVVCINKELAAVNVQPDNAEDAQVLMVGATFNIFVRSRRKPFEWTAVNLEVVDDDYQDDVLFSQRKGAADMSTREELSSASHKRRTRQHTADQGPHAQSAAAAIKRINVVAEEQSMAVATRGSSSGKYQQRVTSPSSGLLNIPAPVPVGFLNNGTAFFAPPCNLPPAPAGYISMMEPYFGRAPSMKPIPAGVTLKGARFYMPDNASFTDGPRTPLAGFDNMGHPFFFPRGAILPPPAGFTPEGIPYYDGISFLQARGILLMNARDTEALKSIEALDESDSDDSAFGSGSSDEVILSGSGGQSQAESNQTIFGIHNTRKRSQVDITQSRADIIRSKVDIARNRANLGKSLAVLKSSSNLITYPRSKTGSNAHLLLEELAEQQPLLYQRMMDVSKSPYGQAARIRDIAQILSRLAGDYDTESIVEPTDIISFLRESDDLAYLKSAPMRLAFEPSVLEFRSVNTPLSAKATLRYRAYRGDRDEHSVFVSIDSNAFSASQTHLVLQGEGTVEITVTFYPRAMKHDRGESSMSLIDDTGKKLAVCTVFAVRKSFVKVGPTTTLHAGWLLPGQKRDMPFRIENVSTVGITLSIQMQGSALPDINIKDFDGTKTPFRVLSDDFRMQPGETKQWNVTYEPKNEGQFKDIIVVKAPGGEMVKLPIHGFAGVPVVVYPETEDNSKLGGVELSKNRSALLRKLRKSLTLDKGGDMNAEEQSIGQKLLGAGQSSSRLEGTELDFGICYSVANKVKNVTRCVTLFNLSDSDLTLALHPHSPAIVCPHLESIPAFAAVSIEIGIKCGDDQPISGNLWTAIEIVCPGFQSIPLSVKAFLGQPLFFLSWDIAFFRPCMIGQTESILLTLVNQSQYDISATLANLNTARANGDMRASSFGSTLSTEEATVIRAQSANSTLFSFLAKERGPLLQTVSFKIVKPAFGDMPSCINGKSLTLVGICIEPYLRSPDDTMDKNGVDCLRQWMSHPKRLIDEYPVIDEERALKFDLVPPPARKPLVLDVVFQRDLLVYRPQGQGTADVTDFNNPRRPITHSLKASNKSRRPVTASFFGSTNFSIDPKKPWLLQPAESYTTEIMFLPPMDRPDSSIVYGFACALQESEHTFHTVSLVCRPALDTIILPHSNTEGQVVVDFGVVDVASYWLAVQTRNVLLVNSGSSIIAWNLKLGGGRTKYSAFEAGTISGELAPSETYAIPFKFHSDVSGVFEVSADLNVKDVTDRLSKGSHLTSVVLRGQSVNTSLTGLPEQIDFGSTVVMCRKTRAFHVSNNGTRDVELRFKVAEPFSVKTKAVIISPREEKVIEVIFKPTESRTSSSKLLVFANHKLWEIILLGIGGTTDLICDRFCHRDLDVGLQREGTIAWVDLYLTNHGTIPLVLNRITADTPNFVKIKYIGAKAAVVDDTSTSEQKSDMRVVKDYWAIFKKKMIVFATLRALLRDMVAKARKLRVEARRPPFSIQQGGRTLVVEKHTEADTLGESPTFLAQLPPLRPLSSYHFLLGCTPKAVTDLRFNYEPLDTMEDGQPDDSTDDLTKSTIVRVTGKTYRSLEFFPPFHDFGLAPAEAFINDERQKNCHPAFFSDYGVTRDDVKGSGTIVNLDVLNLSTEVQNLSLIQITPAFYIGERLWNIQAGDRISIPVEFHPQREQLQYRGEAHFAHTYGIAVVRLAGTGASAEISCDSKIDFGALKVNRVGTRSFRITNHGLLDCHYQLRIIQNTPDFRFIGTEEFFEMQSTLTPGGVGVAQVRCCSGSIEQKDASIMVKWQRVPHGIWEEIPVPLYVEIGMPMFKLHVFELDFETTYMRLGKTLELEISNDGNAECHWTADVASAFVSLEPASGHLMSGETTYIRARYQPTDYDALNTSIMFETDAGSMSLACHGIVGVPFISIPEDHLRIDYGVAAIDKLHSKTVQVTNTGPKTLLFEARIVRAEQDGVELDDFGSILEITPSSGKLQPQQQVMLTCSARPVDYDSLYTATFMFSTNNGEQYDGTITVRGGKAIVTLASITMGRGTGDRAGSPAENMTKEAKAIPIRNHFDVLQTLASELSASQSTAKHRAEAPVKHIPATPKAASIARAPSHVLAQSEEDAVSRKESANTRQSSAKHEAESPVKHVPTTPAFSHVLSRSQEDAISRKDNPYTRKSSAAAPDSGALSIHESHIPEEPVTEEELATILIPFEEFLEDVRQELHLDSAIDVLNGSFNMEKFIKDGDLFIDTISEQISGRFLENKTELAACIRRAHASSRAAKLMERGAGEREARDMTLQEFNLGLVRGGVGAMNVELFTMPNIGNMDFEFTVLEVANHAIRPETPKEGEKPFAIVPMNGQIHPEGSVSFIVNFNATIAGMYRNSYQLVSSGVNILTFSVAGRVGISRIVTDKPAIDFGLIPRKERTMQTLTIKNAGTYQDKWRVVAGPEKDGALATFSFNKYGGDLEPGQETMIEVYFSSDTAGTYTRDVIIDWTGRAVPLQLSAVAGSPELSIEYEDVEDKAMEGLDWGVCIVSCSYAKVLYVKNSGNVDGRFSVVFPSHIFSLEADQDQEGMMAVSPNGCAAIKVIITPDKAGPVSEPFQVVDQMNVTVTVPMKAFCGTCDYQVIGEPKFLNMGVGETQVASVVVKNTGDIEIPLEFRVEPESILTVHAGEFKSGSILMPNVSVTVEVSSTPNMAGVVDGRLSVKTDLGKGQVVKTLTFNFRAYNEQLEVDDTTDINMGRVIVGESQSCTRYMINYGSTPIQYRVSIQEIKEEIEADEKSEKADKSKKKKKGGEGAAKKSKKSIRRIAGALSEAVFSDAPWSIVSACEGTVETGAMVPFEFSFAARDGDGYDFKEVTVVVEKMLTKWTQCAVMKVSAAVGCPRLEFVPSEVNFKVVSVGCEKIMPINFSNKGTALLKYEILQPWDLSEVFSFAPGTSLTGSVPPDESETLNLVFKPSVSQLYSSSISVQTQVGVFNFDLEARGATYELAQRYLPKAIDLGGVFVGEQRDTTVVLRNGCVFELLVSASFTREDLSEINGAEVFEVNPSTMELSPNSEETAIEEECASGDLIIHAEFANPTTENGLADPQAISQFLRLGKIRRKLQVQVEGGATHTIPIDYFYVIHPLTLTRRQGATGEAEMDPILAFGDVSMTDGSSQHIFITNPNLFKISFQATVLGNALLVDPPSGEIDGFGSIEFNMRLPPVNFGPEETIPKSMPISSTIHIATQVEEMGSIDIAASGAYVDIPMVMDFSEPVQLGFARVNRQGTHDFVFSNPVKRRLQWTLRIEQNSSESFWIPEKENTGEAVSGQEIRVPIHFKAMFPISYTCQAFIETSEGSFVAQFTFQGIEPKLIANPESLDFGVVGVDEPEFRVFTI
ncbi:hypothetical protein SeMB42_g01104, partial [Synchytrium endobioticum]